MLKAGESFAPFELCTITRLLASAEGKSIYEVTWRGTPAVLKLSASAPLLPVSHPMWASVLEAANLPDGYALVQNKASGSTLATVLKFGSPTREQRLAWALELCRFFAAASPAAGTVDPSNVLVDDEGCLTVVSLGREQGKPLVSFGVFLEAALGDSAPLAWLAARCRDGRFGSFAQVESLLQEFASGEEPAIFEVDTVADPPPSPRPWAGVMVALGILLVTAIGYSLKRPVLRNEPAVYLASGHTVTLIAEASTRSLGTLRTDSAVTAIAASEGQNRLYLAYQDSPYIDILDGTSHARVGRLLAQPEASELWLSGKSLAAVYPKIGLVVILDTDGKTAQPVSVGTAPLVALAPGRLAVAFDGRLEVYQLAPFALLNSLDLASPPSRLWSEGEEIALAQGERVSTIDYHDGTLRPRQETGTSGQGIETPHGYWATDSSRLIKYTGRGGSVVESWSVEPGADLAYLANSDAP